MTTTTFFRELVPDQHRSAVVHDLFGFNYPLQLEPAVYSIASRMSADYSGAFWNFYRIGESGECFYMAPDADHDFTVRSENGWVGEMSPDAFGLVVMLTAYSWLSFSARSEIGYVYALQFHALRAYAAEHPEAPAIFAAID